MNCEKMLEAYKYKNCRNRDDKWKTRCTIPFTSLV